MRRVDESHTSRRRWLLVSTAVALVLTARIANAGPPFVTDDPEPVEYRHWELYVASQLEQDSTGWSGTAPHVEANYGAIKNLQLHLIAPLAFARPDAGPHAYGPGDIELGAKYRFLDETSWRPQVGTFPLVELPVGNANRGLGSGHTQVFLPVWLQKSYGRWTSYGGGGYWLNPGEGNRNWILVGLEVQRKLLSNVALGAEVFHGTPDAVGADAETRFNVGAMIDLSDTAHVLISGGSGVGGGFQGYLAFQLTGGGS